MKALILIADGFEDLQFFCPYYRLREMGLAVTITGPSTEKLVGKHGYQVVPDSSFHDINPADYDLLLIPGGESPEKLRLREEAVGIARTFIQDGFLLVSIGHGAQLLISAGALDRRSLTCSPGIRDDVRGADATYRDEGVVVDGNLITARGSEDLPVLCKHLVKALGGK